MDKQQLQGIIYLKEQEDKNQGQYKGFWQIDKNVDQEHGYFIKYSWNIMKMGH